MEILEHIVPINFGGSRMNVENWMSVCRHHADEKSGKEAHNPCLVSYTTDDKGSRIPVDRTELFTVLSNPLDRGWVKNS